ncbi:hypothetical protein A2U01_0075063, partial [Trifolium medium]|nr:hypothetical protein [Trifolium medium]
DLPLEIEEKQEKLCCICPRREARMAVAQGAVRMLKKLVVLLVARGAVCAARGAVCAARGTRGSSIYTALFFFASAATGERK